MQEEILDTIKELQKQEITSFAGSAPYIEIDVKLRDKIIELLKNNRKTQEIKAFNPKRIWFNNVLWDVEQVFRPTIRDTFILVKRLRHDQCYFETDIHPVEMRLVDCGNDVFVIDNKKNRQVIIKLLDSIKKVHQGNETLREYLQDNWRKDCDKLQPRVPKWMQNEQV